MGLFSQIFEAGKVPHSDVPDVAAVNSSACDNTYCAATSVARTLKLPCGDSVCLGCVETMSDTAPVCPECDDSIDLLWALTNIAPLWDAEHRRNTLLREHYRKTTGWSPCSCGGGATTAPAKDTKGTCIVCGTTICTFHGEAHEGPCDERAVEIVRTSRWESGGVPCSNPDCGRILTVEEDDCDAVTCTNCQTVQNIAGGDSRTHSFKYKNTRETLDRLSAGTTLPQLKGMLAKNELFDQLFDVTGIIEKLRTMPETEEQLRFISRLAFPGLRACLSRIVQDDRESVQLAIYAEIEAEEIVIDRSAQYYRELEKAPNVAAVFNLLSENENETWVDPDDQKLFLALRRQILNKVRARKDEPFIPEIDVAGTVAAIKDPQLKEKCGSLMRDAHLLA